MKSLKPYVFFAFILVGIDATAQNVVSLEPGTFSNRTTDGLNNGNTVPANKTWTFYDYTSGWDSKYYNGNTALPAYTEGWLCRRYSTNDSKESGFVMNYRLLFPVGYNPAESYKYPLIIMMHGLGERGNGTATSNDYLNNDKNLIHGGQPHLNAVYLANGKKAEDPALLSKSFPGIVLFPQTANTEWYYSGETDKATFLIEQIIANYNVDPDRVYVHGLSNGGRATWDLVRTKPQLYAAALPMSATVTPDAALFTSEVSKVVPIPTWVFQGGTDTSPSPNNTNKIVSQLRAAGADVRYKIYPTLGHAVWGNAYAEPDFFSWMLSKNKSDITVLYQNTTICPTNNAGAQLALGTGFLAYQWEKDGVIISGATSSSYTASTAGSYRARYSRISASPSEAQWNKWSAPVVVTETSAVSTSISTTSSPHLPDINLPFPTFIDWQGTKQYSVRIQGPTTADLEKDWFSGTTLQSDTSNYIVRTVNEYNIGNVGVGGVAGTYTLQTKSLSGCPSLVSKPIYVTTGTPSTLTAPTNFQAQVNSSGSIQLFWTDNANNETGYEIVRATSSNGPFAFYKLLGEDIVSYEDTGLIPNTTYYYRIRAVNNVATSPYNASNLVVSTSNDTTPPTAPQTLVRITNSVTSIKLGWTASTDISGIKKYIIYYGGNSIDTGSADTNYTITDLTPNTNYTFTVKAVDNADLLSQPSNQLLASTFFSGLDYEHTPDNVADDIQHSPANSLYGINWGYTEHTGHVDNVSIAPRVQDNYFNFKYNGYLKVPTNGTYYFRINANDAANLYLGTSGYLNTTTAFTYPGVNSYWKAINSGLPGSEVRNMYANSASILYAATGVGIYKTTNTGTSWALSSTGLTNTDVRWITASGSNIFASTAGGVFLSTNAGAGWTAMNSGLTNTDVRHVVALSTSNFMASTAGGVFLSTNTGASWTAVNSGLSNTNVRSIAFNGTSITTATAGGVFLSTNNGSSWTAKNSGLSNTDVRSIVMYSTTVWFAGTASGLFITKDAGSSWYQISSGLTNTSIRSLIAISNSAYNVFVTTDSGVFMYTYLPNVTSVEQFWASAPVGLTNTTVNSITNNGANLYASTSSGALFSINSGASWNGTNRIIQLNGNHDTCTEAISGGIALNTTNFYPLSLIYYDLVDSECLTLEYQIGSNSGTWITVPDSFFSSGTAPVPTTPVVPGNLTATSMGMSSIQLTWSHALATDDFEIYRSTDDVNYAIVATVTTDNLHTYTDTSLTPATVHYYKIRSINATGGMSALTTSVNATTDADSEAPTVPQNVVVVTYTYTNAGLKWDASTDNVQVAGYKIFADGNLLGTSTVATYFTTVLAPSTSYSFTVKAYDLNGNESTASSAAIIVTTGPATFFSKSSVDLSLLSSWGTNTNGTGTAPTDFSFNGQQFIVRANANLTNAWVIGGTTSRVVVNPNVTLTLSNKLTGKINLLASANVLVNYTAADFNYDFDAVSATSNVTFNTYSSVPMDKYGNVTLNGTGVKIIPTGVMEVQGNLTLASGLELKGAAGNATTINIKGNLTTGTTPATISADNLVTIQFSEDDFHNFILTNAQNFYKITANANSSVAINNTSGSPKVIKLGSLNGGGLDLASGSIFSLTDNTTSTNNILSITGAGTINTTNSTGQLSMLGGDIQLTTSSSFPSNLYFVSGENKVQNLTLQSTGGGLTSIREPLEIYDGVKINAGTLSSGGNITLKSDSLASASLRQIVNGSVTGNIIVERYLQPKGRMYRYMSTSVAGVTVADLQAYIPVTGPFTGASTGAGLGGNASMFTYTEPAYAQFPVSTNTEQLQVGKGYSVFVRETADSTLITTGVANQGNINFTGLTGGTGVPSDGYNLVGNPYPSDVVWGTTGWAFSGINDVISISENLPNGVLQWKIWNKATGLGTLDKGKIPAGQAFWVQTTIASPSMSVSEASKTAESADKNTEYYRTAARDISSSSFSFLLDNGTYQDYTFVSFSEEGTDAFNKLKDGAKRQNSFFNLSTSSSDGVTLAMNDLSNEFCEKIIPVNIENATTGSYHLKFNNTDQFVMGNIVLQDKYLGTEQVISASNKDVVITLDNNAASSKNRFYIKLSRPDVLTNMTAASDKKNFCSSEEMVTVTVNNSQPNVDYTAFIGTNSTGVKQTGTGDAIQLQVPVSLLAANQNNISIQASFPGCTAKSLDKLVVVNKTSIPELTGVADYYGCVGSAMDIKVNSSSSINYRWKDITNSKDLSETTGTLSIAQLADVNYYSVSAVDANGCESISKSILVRSDTLVKPVVVIDNDVLSVSTKGEDIQWLLNGQIIPDAISKEYTPSISGDYIVKVTNNYCVKESEPVSYIITGLGEPTNGELSLQLYPNPSEHGDITITGQSNSTSSLQIQLLDLAGRQIIHRETSYEEYAKGVKVKGELSAGAYIVRVIQDGTIRFKKLLVL